MRRENRELAILTMHAMGSLAAARPASPLLRRRAAAEREQLETVIGELASRVAVVPRLVDDPVGVAALAELADAGAVTASA